MKATRPTPSYAKRHRAITFALLVATSFAVMQSGVAEARRDATANNEWISFGIPTRINVGSSPGYFYMMGSDQGSCGSVMPTYFRSDMSLPYWKEFYAMVILAHAHQAPMECIVANGCGTNEVWVTYCTVDLHS